MNSTSMNTPKLRFKEFSNSWQVENFSSCFERVTRKNIEDNRNILTISAQQGLVMQDKFFKKLVAAKDVSNYYLLHKDDYAYNKSYSNGYPMGAIKRLKNYDKGVVSTLYICFKSLNSKSVLFFDQYFDAGVLNTEIEKIAQEGARNHGLLNMSVIDFFKMKLVVPDIKEQIKISVFLKSIDDKIFAQFQKVELLKVYKIGIIQSIFKQDIRFRDDNGNNYPDWEDTRLSELLTKRSLRNTKLEVKEVFSVAKTAGVINQIEHLGRSFASSDISNYKISEPDDIIYTKSPTSDFPYGIIKQNKLNRRGVVSVLYGVYKPINKYSGYLIDAYFNSWKNTYNYLNPIVQKGAKNTINIGDNAFLDGASIPFSINESEQEKIVKFINILENKISIENAKLEQIYLFKKALQQQMFV